jgi:uncharacterized metal-binding protein
MIAILFESLGYILGTILIAYALTSMSLLPLFLIAKAIDKFIENNKQRQEDEMDQENRHKSK